MAILFAFEGNSNQTKVRSVSVKAIIEITELNIINTFVLHYRSYTHLWVSDREMYTPLPWGEHQRILSISPRFPHIFSSPLSPPKRRSIFPILVFSSCNLWHLYSLLWPAELHFSTMSSPNKSSQICSDHSIFTRRAQFERRKTSRP